MNHGFSKHEKSKLKKCKVGRTIDELGEPHKTQLVELLASDLSARKLSLLLSKASLSIHYTTLNDHRLGVCACARTS